MDHLFTNLNQWFWFGLAVILMILELTGTAGFLLWTGIAAAIVGAMVWLFPAMYWPFQWLIFACAAILAGVLWWLHLKKSPIKTDKPTLNRRSEQYVGRIFTLQEPINNGRGKLTIDGSPWRIQGPDTASGAQVKVVRADGVILVVIKLD